MVSTTARLLSLAARSRNNGSFISRMTSSNLGASSSVLATAGVNVGATVGATAGGNGNGNGTSFLNNFTKRWNSGYPDHEVVGMPSLSPTMEAGTIASWNLGEGESFGAGDVLCEVETDKATVSFEAQDDGVIAKILAEAGPSEIDCGVPILITVEDESDVDAFKDYVVEAAATPAASQSASAPPTPAPTPPPVTPTPAPTPVSAPTTTTPAAGERVVASPLAWTIAKEKGFDLLSIAIAGTGPDGRVIADDVREYIPIKATIGTTVATTASASTTTASAAPTSLEPIVHDNYTDYPVNEASIATANLLSHSKQTIPHYYLTVDVTLDSLIDLRSTLNKTLGEDNEISLNDLLIKAAASAMKSCPSANASWMGDSVRMYNSVDMNVVMGNGDTLYAPLIQGVDTKGVKSISDQVTSNLVDIEEGTVGDNSSFSEVGTVTFMNLGMYGVKSCAPIIRAPQAVAVALGAAENRVVPKEGGDDGDLYDTSVMLTATLSCDHRVVDGAVGAQWLSAFKAAVESPETLLL